METVLKALSLCALVLTVSGAGGTAGVLQTEDTSAQTSEQPPPGLFPMRVTIAFVGDLLMHVPIGNSVRDRASGSYDFAQVFAPVADYIQWPDYAVANLETRLAGPRFGYHGYPRFNTPSDLAPALRETGFDLMATANNHSLDYGWAGVVNTLDTLDAAGLAHIGTHRNREEQAEPFVADIGGIRVAFLNYTSSLNGIPLPSGRPYACNVVNTDRIAREVQSAREREADIVVLILHFGNEYQRTPAESQRSLARTLCERGVDVIVGAHPHVVQPIERISVMRDGVPHSCLAAYSLGNFVSCQRERYRDSGIILYVTLEKTTVGSYVSEVEYLPVWVQQSRSAGRTTYRVVPVHPGLGSEAFIILSSSDRERMTQVWDEMRALLENEDQAILPWDGEMLSRVMTHL